MSSNDSKESADISSLQQSFSKQQKKISALKELVRNQSSSSAQEKVKNIAQRLTHLKSKARSRQSTNAPQQDERNEAEAEESQQLSQTLPNIQHSMNAPMGSKFITLNPSASTHQSSGSNISITTTTTPGSEKVILLRQQMEQNKALMAQRASSKQHLEQLVTQLKEKFDSTQQCIEDTTELGRSMSDLSAFKIHTSQERHRSATDLTTQPFNLEKERIKFLENRCRLLEKQLEKEKQGNANRDAFNDSTASQASSKRIKELENKVLELEEALTEKRAEVEEIELFKSSIAQKDAEILSLRQEKIERPNEDTESNELLTENERLSNDLAAKLKRISELENVNDMLETTRCDLLVKHSEFEDNIKQLQMKLNDANETVQKLQDELSESETKYVSLLETLEKLQNTTKAVVVESRKDTDSQVKAEMAKEIQELRDEIEQAMKENSQLKQAICEKEKLEISDADIAEKVINLQSTIESQRADLNNRMESMKNLEEELMEKTIELNVLNANFKVLEEKLQSSTKTKSLFSSSGLGDANNSEMQVEVHNLKQKLDESNKAMIKLKLKYKQSEKQIEKLKKGSDLHVQVVDLERTNEELQQRIVELEDEKGQWQLTQVEESKAVHGEADMTDTCKTLTDTVRLLEEQKYELSKELEHTQKDLEELQNQIKCLNIEESARVKSEMSEIHLEEELEKQGKQITALQEELSSKRAEIEGLEKSLKTLDAEKLAVDKKLDLYIAENIELLDKVEKLSKSSSSAESIEIVERLTQQERAEMDEFHKELKETPTEHEHTVSSVNELTQTEMGPELSESLIKLREESSELMNKIELFTAERREVLEKMEHLTAENTESIIKIEELSQQKKQLEANALVAEKMKSQLEVKLQELSKEKELLASQVAESSTQKAQLTQELTSLQKSSEVVAALDSADGATLFDKCEKSLSKLNSELESYRKANDKNSKFNASKKLAKEAKNVHTQLSELLQKVKEASTAVETVTVVETVVAVTAPNGKALAEYEQLTAQNRELKTTIEELRRELEEAQENAHDSELTIAEVPAIAEREHVNNKLQQSLEQVQNYEEEFLRLQSLAEDLRLEMLEARTSNEEKASEILRLCEELSSLRKNAEDFDRLLNDKEMTYEKQIEQLIRLRKELEGKCETYEGEMDILQTLVSEQKQQLIEAYKENEHEMNLKLLELQQRDEQIKDLRAEVRGLRDASVAMGDKVSQDIRKECDELRESLKINKALVADQVNELSNKQETIDTLNQQIIDLYKAMEENANKLIEKEDELEDLQRTIDENNKELDRLRKDNKEQKFVVDKLLNELHSHRQSAQNVSQLETDLQRLTKENKSLEVGNKELEQRNKDQLEKMKKYAVSLKKRTAQCQELELKMKNLEKEVADTSTQARESCGNELQELTTNNNFLNERINELETKLTKNEELSNDLQQSLQTKTAELLDMMEALSESEKQIGELNRSLEAKTSDIARLNDDIDSAQDQISRSSNVPLENVSNSTLQEELVNKSSSLERAEALLQVAENELLLLRERASERETVVNEMQGILKEKNETICTLQDNIRNLDEVVRSKEQLLSEVTEELKAKALKFEKSKAVIKERNNQIHRLQAQLRELKDKNISLTEEENQQTKNSAALQSEPVSRQPEQAEEEYKVLKDAYEQLRESYSTEKATFQETISRLETVHDGIQAKLQEDMSYIETLEQENMKFKEKICKLEECVASFEERRASMERRANLLDAQMQTRADEYEKTEDELIYRLNMLSEHDEVIGQRLLDSQEEKESMQDRLDKLQQQLKEMNVTHGKLENDYQNYRDTVSKNLEVENEALREKLKVADAETGRLRATYDAKLAAKTTEIDELECELSDQLDNINAEKRALSEDLEKTRDECFEQKDEIVRLKESLSSLEQAKHELERESTWLRMQNESSQQDQYELQELRMQNMQDKTEMDNLRHQIEILSSNHEIELQALRDQIAELDSLRMQVGQNQTDDQVFIETENKRLTDLLAEKEGIIENYQRQNLLLHVAPGPQNQHAQMDTPVMARNSADERERVAHELNEKTALIDQLQHELSACQSELQRLLEVNREVQEQLKEKSAEIENLRTGPQFVNDVIPAPMFFASEQAQPSPFDEIVSARTVNMLEGAVANRDEQVRNTVGTERPTIEDLQRNVSDLEKHAQGLESKLVLRNQQDCEYVEQLRALQEHVVEVERIARNREENLQRTQLALDATTMKLHEVEQELKKRNENRKESELQANNSNADANGSKNLSQTQDVHELQHKIEQLQQLLRERDNELSSLKRSQEEEKLLQQSVHLVESQIIPNVLSNLPIGSSAAPVPTLDMFFKDSSAQEFDNLTIPLESDEPVVEPAIVPKKAYICHPEGSETKITAFDLSEDWGGSWGSPEAIEETAQLSAGAKKSVSLISRERQLELKLQEESERIQELQMALERCEAQKQEQQVKSGKLMKKLKEYKTKIDELQMNINTSAGKKSSSAEPASMFDDLDAAIQEELKMQIKKLEAQLQEEQSLQQNHAMEKEKLLKRIDVLTAGNERMSEMKERQDMDVQMYQSRIRDLQEKLNSLEDWGEDSTSVNKPTKEVNEELADEMDAGNHTSNAKCQELEQQLSELRAEIQDSNNDRYELQALLDEEKANVTRAEETIKAMQSRIDDLESRASLAPVTTSVTAEELSVQLQEKESEIAHLTQRIEDLMREDQTEKLVLEILTKNQEIHMLRMQVKRLEDDRQELESNLALQITNDLQTDRSEDASAIAQLQNQVDHLQMQTTDLQKEKSDMEEELKVLNNHVLHSLDMEDKLKSSALELDTKNIEITELRKSLETLKASISQAESTASGTTSTGVDLAAVNSQWEKIVEQKCGEIAQMWRNHLEQREMEFKLTESHLQEQIASLQTSNSVLPQQQQQKQGVSEETTATSTPTSESTTASGQSSAVASKSGTPLRARIGNANEDDADAIIEKMQVALENQEMEIVTLKEQLAIRSAEYARLAAQYDPFKLQTTLSHSGMSPGNSGLESLQTRRNTPHTSPEDASVVPKSELDLALYMLHQRDMRCEEMTLELVSLLEERDTLQLKLSNTLRQVEAIKAQTHNLDQSLPQSEATARSASNDSPSQAGVAGTAADDSTNELNQKLSQLQTVKHSRDKVIKEEREQRNRQMDVAKIPPAAVSELVGADFSQSNQSPSSVLLNWLWGNKPHPGDASMTE